MSDEVGSFTRNVVLTVKYLTLMLIFTVLSVIALRWPRAGGSLYQLFGMGFCVWILMTRKALNLGVVLGWMPVTLPLLFLGVLFWVGRPKPVSLAYKISVLVPAAVAVGFAVEPLARIAGRVDDGDRGPRMVPMRRSQTRSPLFGTHIRSSSIGGLPRRRAGDGPTASTSRAMSTTETRHQPSAARASGR